MLQQSEEFPLDGAPQRQDRKTFLVFINITSVCINFLPLVTIRAKKNQEIQANS